MVSNPTASNRVTVNNPTANNRATMEGILSKDTEADMELLSKDTAADISRPLPRDMALVPAEERRWVWEEACWAAC